MPHLSTKQLRPRPIALFILEGFGVAPNNDSNALAIAKTPFLDQIASHYPLAVLEASGQAIGLETKTPGSSAIGHTVLGTGRPWFNKAHFINEQLDNGSFAKTAGFEQLRPLLGERNIHLEVFLSHAESEYSLKRLNIFLKWLSKSGQKNIFLHVVLDGQMSSPTSGQGLVKELEKTITRLPNCQIVSLIGQLYAFDNKHNETRLQKAFSLLTKAEGNLAPTPASAIAEAYGKKIFDEEFPPTVITGGAEPVTVKNQDIFIFWNYQLKNHRGLLKKFFSVKFSPTVFTLTDEKSSLKAKPLFILPQAFSSLGKTLATAGLKQLRLTDSTAFPAATSFFDGGNPVQTQVKRQLVPVAVNLPPLEVALNNIQKISQLAIEAVNESLYDFLVVTFSQADTIAHHGESKDVLSVIEKIDNRLRVMTEAVIAAGGLVFITSSHGFVEQLINPATGSLNRKHSLNPVIFSVLSKKFEGYNLGWPEASGGDLSLLRPIGTLADVAPTILKCANLDIPPEMTGRSLIS